MDQANTSYCVWLQRQGNDCFIQNIKQIFPLTQSLIYLITYERRIQSPVEHLRWSVLQRQLKPFSRHFFWQSAPTQIFDTVLNTPLFIVLKDCLKQHTGFHRISLLKIIAKFIKRLLQQNLFLVKLQDYKLPKNILRLTP